MVLEIREKAGRRYVIPVPFNFLINLAVRESWFRIALKYNGHLTDEQTEKYMQYLSAIDFGDLRTAIKSIHAKGLTLVEIDSTDGTYVKIKS